MDLFLFTAFGDNWEGDIDRLASLCAMIVVTSLQCIGTILQVNKFTCKHVVVCGGVPCPQNSAIGLLRVGQSGTRPERWTSKTWRHRTLHQSLYRNISWGLECMGFVFQQRVDVPGLAKEVHSAHVPIRQTLKWHLPLPCGH